MNRFNFAWKGNLPTMALIVSTRPVTSSDGPLLAHFPGMTRPSSQHGFAHLVTCIRRDVDGRVGPANKSPSIRYVFILYIYTS